MTIMTCGQIRITPCWSKRQKGDSGEFPKPRTILFGKIPIMDDPTRPRQLFFSMECISGTDEPVGGLVSAAHTRISTHSGRALGHFRRAGISRGGPGRKGRIFLMEFLFSTGRAGGSDGCFGLASANQLFKLVPAGIAGEFVNRHDASIMRLEQSRVGDDGDDRSPVDRIASTGEF
jgi:hypothetical protein